MVVAKKESSGSLFTEEDLLKILDWAGFERKRGYRGLALHGVCPIHDGADNPAGFTAYIDTHRHEAGAFICFTKNCLAPANSQAKGEDAFGFVAKVLDRNRAYEEGVPLEMASKHANFGDAKRKIEELLGRPIDGNFTRQVVGYHDFFRKQVDRMIDSRQVEMRVLAEETLKEYRGFHPYMLGRGYSQEILDEFEVGYSPKEERITIPMRDVNGDLIAVARRVVDNAKITKDNPKYLHHSFSKSEFLYNLHRVKRLILEDKGLTKLIYPGILIVEGQLDVLRLAQYGFPLSVAVGSSALSKHQGMLLECITDQVTVILDSDKAGKKLVESAKAVLGKFVTVYAATVPRPYKDVGDISGEYGIDLIHYILENRKRV